MTVDDKPKPKTVSQLTREIKQHLEEAFPFVWVVGEVSNCAHASSGHVYLTLKDDNAQLRAVMWRGTASRLKFELEDGLEVVAAGAIELYQPRGTYQLIIEQMLPQGVGALELAFRQLHDKLAAEGLFDVERKRPLPRIPKRIAIVTSPTSAAIRDMLQVVTRRWPAVDIVILPVAVQGTGAAEEIAAAIRYVPNIPDVDVVIAGRGGGSLEDLWAFNEEPVARAIAACPIPLISAVGHEIDVTIADLVADRRALTPSEAGELVVPDAGELRASLSRHRDRLTAGLRQTLTLARTQLEALSERRLFTRPLDRIRDMALELDELSHELNRAVRTRLNDARSELSRFSASLEALSPLKVLQRGYSVTRHLQTGKVLRSSNQLAVGDEIVTQLAAGEATSRVESIQPETTTVANNQPEKA